MEGETKEGGSRTATRMRRLKGRRGRWRIGKEERMEGTRKGENLRKREGKKGGKDKRRKGGVK